MRKEKITPCQTYIFLSLEKYKFHLKKMGQSEEKASFEDKSCKISLRLIEL